MSNPTLRLATAIVIAICVTSTCLAQAQSDIVPGNAAIEDFELTPDFLFEFEGTVLANAKICASKRHVAYLVITPELEAPLLVSPRGKSVQTVQVEELTRREFGASLGAGFPLDYLGEYELKRGEMIFDLDGKTASLKAAPALLGVPSALSAAGIGHLAKGMRRKIELSRRPPDHLFGIRSHYFLFSDSDVPI